ACRLRPAAALRAGCGGGAFPAGTGFQWRDVTVDYAFENNPLATTHRAGLTLHFGATTEENRLAHQRAEDAKVEQRLAEGFRERQAAQGKGVMGRAGEARARGGYGEAAAPRAAGGTRRPRN